MYFESYLNHTHGCISNNFTVPIVLKIEILLFCILLYLYMVRTSQGIIVLEESVGFIHTILRIEVLFFNIE